jgi:hypothetical protein
MFTNIVAGLFVSAALIFTGPGAAVDQAPRQGCCPKDLATNAPGCCPDCEACCVECEACCFACPECCREGAACCELALPCCGKAVTKQASKKGPMACCATGECCPAR